MDQVIDPVLLYGLLVVGGVGVAMALPRARTNPQPIGGLIAAAAGGLIVLVLSVGARGHLPNLYFYIFAAVALGAALRVITHPRPVYAALYFVLTILASAGLYLVLSAEFMAFALVIVYAGAILITYLFVIMLATQAPTEEEVEKQAEYDTTSREPLAGTVVGFVLLGVLTTLLFRGLPELPPPGESNPDAVIAELPGRVEAAFREAGRYNEIRDTRIVAILPRARTVTVEVSPGVVNTYDWPESLSARNVDEVGFSLLARHPGAIEIAGVVLLMAMLGAVVLARKQVELEEQAKARQAARLRLGPAEDSP